MEGICCDCGETNKTACPAHWKSGSCFRLQPIKEATVGKKCSDCKHSNDGLCKLRENNHDCTDMNMFSPKSCYCCIYEVSDPICLTCLGYSKWESTAKYKLKEATVTHKQLKPISAEVIIKFNPPKIEFIKFLNEWGINDDIVGIRDGAVAFNNFITHIKEYHPCWLPWFEKHGFIEKVEEEVFYHVGQEFVYNGTRLDFDHRTMCNGDIFVLKNILMAPKYVYLLHLGSNSPYCIPVEVWNIKKIHKVTFDLMCDGNQELFTLYKEAP